MRATIFCERVGFLVVIYTIHIDFVSVNVLARHTFDFSKPLPHFRCKIFSTMYYPSSCRQHLTTLKFVISHL